MWMIWDGDASAKGSRIQEWLTTSFLLHSSCFLPALLKTVAAEDTNWWITSGGMFKVAASKTDCTASSLSRISVAPLAGMALHPHTHTHTFEMTCFFVYFCFSFMLFIVKTNEEVSASNTSLRVLVEWFSNLFSLSFATEQKVESHFMLKNMSQI